MSNAEKGISVQEGPRIDRTIASTVVKAESDGGYWISTIRLAGEPRKKYETVVFSVPTEVDVFVDMAGEPTFDGPIEWVETLDTPVTSYNRTGMQRVDAAQRHHARAVEAASVALRTQG